MFYEKVFFHIEKKSNKMKFKCCNSLQIVLWGWFWKSLLPLWPFVFHTYPLDFILKINVTTFIPLRQVAGSRWIPKVALLEVNFQWCEITRDFVVRLQEELSTTEMLECLREDLTFAPFPTTRLGSILPIHVKAHVAHVHIMFHKMW